jgi:hypothetical protein
MTTKAELIAAIAAEREAARQAHKAFEPYQEEMSAINTGKLEVSLDRLKMLYELDGARMHGIYAIQQAKAALADYVVENESEPILSENTLDFARFLIADMSDVEPEIHYAKKAARDRSAGAGLWIHRCVHRCREKRG